LLSSYWQSTRQCLSDPSGHLFPLSKQYKSRPEVRRRPAFLSGHFKLSRPQSRPRWQTVFEHPLIKKLHQFRRRQIVYSPQTCDHARRASIHKSAGQPDQSLALDLFAQSSLACAEHDQIGVELEVVDLMQSQKSVLWLSLPVKKREDQPGKFWPFAVEQTVGRKMHDAVLTQFPALCHVAAGVEVNRFEPCSSRSQRNDAVGFIAREGEPYETEAGVGKIHSPDRALQI